MAGQSRSSFGNCTSLRLRWIRAIHVPLSSRSSFGNCTSLRRHRPASPSGRFGSQFLRELHFIEASGEEKALPTAASRSSFGNCTSLRQVGIDMPIAAIDPHLLLFVRHLPGAPGPLQGGGQGGE